MKLFQNVPNKSARAKRFQRGYSMVEVGLVMVLAGIIGVGMMSYFSKNSSAAQADMLRNDLSTLIGNVKSAYGGAYSGITNAKLNTGGFFNDLPSMVNTAGVVSTNLGGGTLTVTPGQVTTANDSAKYVITQLPDSACLPLVTALAKSATTLSLGASIVKAAGGKPDPSKITCSGDANTLTIQVQ